jgi:hypothetical protein
MNTIQMFEKNKYVHLKNILDKDTCNSLSNELKILVEQQKTIKDPQCPKSEAIHGAVIFDQLLEYCLPIFEQASGKQLYPTYSYARLYAPDDELIIHTDRESCEISATITLGFDDKCWGIFMGDNPDKSNGVQIVMDVGDAVLYKGMEKQHWREKFKGKWQAQVFLHYVDQNGKYADWKYDKRESLGIPKNDTLDVCYTYPSAISAGFCENLIKEYSQESHEKELPYIGNGQVDYSVRNVKRLPLPFHAGIGGTLTAIGLNINNEFWKFNITHSNQAEFLMYDVNGKYEEHIDTFHKHTTECRKITVIAILNDDFEGGKFYVKNGNLKVYPKQEKGDVIVFPSFLAHGVEPVTKGQRFSVVTWLVGEYFK